MKITKTEQYIKDAVTEAKKEFSGGNSIADCCFTMHMEADGATHVLAQALEKQANANHTNSQAMLKLAETLKPIDACAIRVTNDYLKTEGYAQ